MSPPHEELVGVDLDPVIHAPVRLRLMVVLTELQPGATISFSRLQELLGLTPGNLITHLRKLDDAGYVHTRKEGRVTTDLLLEAQSDLANAERDELVAIATYNISLIDLELVQGTLLRHNNIVVQGARSENQRVTAGRRRR